MPGYMNFQLLEPVIYQHLNGFETEKFFIILNTWQWFVESDFKICLALFWNIDIKNLASHFYIIFNILIKFIGKHLFNWISRWWLLFHINQLIFSVGVRLKVLLIYYEVTIYRCLFDIFSCYLNSRI